jgi:hypothetical protein
MPLYIGIEDDSVVITFPFPDNSGKALIAELTAEAALEVSAKLRAKAAELKDYSSLDNYMAGEQHDLTKEKP